MNAIELLRADHDRLRGILPKLSDTSIAADERKKLLETIEREIKIHSLLEEEIFYPVFKDEASAQEDRDMYYEAIEEHHVVDMLLPEMKGLDPTSDGFRAKGSVLSELFEHHAGEEEEDMFPKAEKLISAAQLAELGTKMEARRRELEQQWETRIGAFLRKAQSVADKFAPSSMKDARVEANRSDPE